MVLHDLFANRQANTVAGKFMPWMQSLEYNKDLISIFLVKADAVVNNFYFVVKIVIS